MSKINNSGFKPESVTDEEIHAASLQFVRKVSGFNKPSKANEPAFNRAVDEIAAISARMLGALETNAPPCVEITVHRSTTGNAYLVGLVNYQKELPNVPVRDIAMTLRLPGVKKPTACTRVSDGKRLEVKSKGGALMLEVPWLETLEMIEVTF